MKKYLFLSVLFLSPVFLSQAGEFDFGYDLEKVLEDLEKMQELEKVNENPNDVQRKRKSSLKDINARLDSIEEEVADASSFDELMGEISPEEEKAVNTSLKKIYPKYEVKDDSSSPKKGGVLGKIGGAATKAGDAVGDLVTRGVIKGIDKAEEAMNTRIQAITDELKDLKKKQRKEALDKSQKTVEWFLGL